jgi:hypothetical protein
MKLNRKITLVLAMAATATGLGWSSGQAQTATNLICNGCVGYKDIGKKAVRNKNIDKGTIKPNRLRAPTGAAGTQSSSVGAVTNTIVGSITVEIPSKGVVVVNASSYAYFSTNGIYVTCTITKETTTGSPYLRANGANDADSQRAIIAGTRAFEESSGGTYTYNLVCSRSGGTITMYTPTMTAIYAPTNILSTP